LICTLLMYKKIYRRTQNIVFPQFEKPTALTDHVTTRRYIPPPTNRKMIATTKQRRYELEIRQFWKKTTPLRKAKQHEHRETITSSGGASKRQNGSNTDDGGSQAKVTIGTVTVRFMIDPAKRSLLNFCMRLREFIKEAQSMGTSFRNIPLDGKEVNVLIKQMIGQRPKKASTNSIGSGSPQTMFPAKLKI
jgi:hypothetical protein